MADDTSEIETDYTNLVQQLDQLVVSHGEEMMTTKAAATNIPKIELLLQSVCMIKTPGGGHGTGFLADIPNQGIAFLSAGHNFKSGSELPDDLDISKFSLHFGNINGDLSGAKALKTCILKDLGPVKGSIGYKEKRIYFPGNFPGKALKHEDYCVLVFTAPGIKETLKTMGLAYLKCAHGGFLKHIPGGLLFIISRAMQTGTAAH